MDVGPCFGTNEHPRRDTDLILRLSKSTIEDLSSYIGFVKELMVKMVVYDETMTFVRLFMKNRFCSDVFFDPGSILGLFKHRNIFWGIETSKFYKIPKTKKLNS